VRGLTAALMCISLPLGACRDVSAPIEGATTLEIPFDEAVPRRDPRAVHTYSLETVVSREVVRGIVEEQLYTFVHVTRCADRKLIAIAEARLDQIDLMDFDALRAKLEKDPARRFRLNAKFSSSATLSSGQACVAFNGGGYLGGQVLSRPTPIAVRSTSGLSNGA
jgi:hypothetical protein